LPPRGVWFCIAAGLGALTSYDTALSQEIHGPCSQAVGTFLTTNEVHKDGEKATSRSVIALTNGGYALLSREQNWIGALSATVLASGAATAWPMTARFV